MKSLREYIAESEFALSNPVTGDTFDIEIESNYDNYLLETYVIDSGEDHVIVECDSEGLQLLESAGCSFSEECHTCDHSTEECVCEEDMDEAKYHGRTVQLNKPMAGDVKKSKVYVKDPKTGNIKKVNFGAKGMRIKKNNPKRRKSFRARHKCQNPGPKTKAKYWSCRAW